MSKYVQIPVWVIERTKGSAGAFQLYAAIFTYRNNGSGCAWPSQDRLSEDLGMSSQSVMRHLKVLEALKLVSVKRGKQGSQRAVNVYSFLQEDGSPCIKSDTRPPPKNDTRPPLISDTRPPIKNDEIPPITDDSRTRLTTELDLVELDKELFIIDEPMTEPVADNGFDTFWVNYPRKVGKGQAKKAYEKALKVASRDEILAGAKRLTDDPNLPELTYVKHASTWLAAESWTDEPFPTRHVTNDKQQGIDERTAHAKKLMTGEAEYRWL